MRLNKASGRTLTTADIGASSTAGKPLKRKRADKGKADKVVEEKKKSGKTSASGAGASETRASEEITASEHMTSDNVQASEDVNAETEPIQEKVQKKPRSERKKASRVLRRLKIQDDEDTDEEPLVNKRMRT
ncbi:hypothetical protein A2U01_0054462, partial [Trifolium medium]|nr:hypothetical protein [Trifolium medium]